MGNTDPNTPTEATPTSPKSFGDVLRSSIQELKETFVAFIKAPRALWGVNIPYVMEGLVYFGILTILGKYCSENVGLTDAQAGWVYSGVTGGITFAMLLFGGVTDKIGVRRSLALALGVMTVGRGLIALSGTIPLGQGMGSPMFLTMCAGLLLMVAAYGLYMPAAYAGVKRYTNPKTAAVAYAVLYGLMNLGAFFSGFISPLVRHRFAKIFPPNGLTAVFWVYTGLVFLAMIITLLILSRKTDAAAVARVARESREMSAGNGEDKKEESAKPKQPTVRINNIPLYVYSVLSVAGLAGVILADTGTLAIPSAVGYVVLAIFGVVAIYEYLRHRSDHPFRDKRFVFFIFILIPVQTLFAHNWLTIPYYLDRAFRGTMVSQYFELFSNINPVLIFIFAPIVAGLTARRNVYKMMIAGTLVMALPTFLLATGPNVIFFISYILLMSIGEAMWQPRFLQWIAEIAPEGKTGMYMGIGQFPWFLTKVLTGLYSGIMVAKYIPQPETGEPMNTGFLWLIYGFIAMVSPVALILARKWMMGGMAKQQNG